MTRHEPLQLPPPGTLFRDTGHGDRVGEFCGVAGPYWSLRPVGGGVEWEAEPEWVRALTPAERLSVENALRNLRSSRGGL
ncbi:hypothetical protein PUR34_27165 [Streptomyces sp. JV185]|uniref:hypothetical protein n=1 Tax=Streptomyces sp. JV185 TaxID=858638 RepID=UPI002E7A6ACF|nr:hypothetical protein [Streptomyces sp. JV185]MEE1771735.1 hypothetical protein [Streptomyces sp. JV185]